MSYKQGELERANYTQVTILSLLYCTSSTYMIRRVSKVVFNLTSKYIDIYFLRVYAEHKTIEKIL